MREQAKKMNVSSLRSGDQKDGSAEAKLAKVRISLINIHAFINLICGTYLVNNISYEEIVNNVNIIFKGIFGKKRDSTFFLI